ncbi:MAG: calcium-binding protein [Pseudomonadota bacterium]
MLNILITLTSEEGDGRLDMTNAGESLLGPFAEGERGGAPTIGLVPGTLQIDAGDALLVLSSSNFLPPPDPQNPSAVDDFWLADAFEQPAQTATLTRTDLGFVAVITFEAGAGMSASSLIAAGNEGLFDGASSTIILPRRGPLVEARLGSGADQFVAGINGVDVRAGGGRDDVSGSQRGDSLRGEAGGDVISGMGGADEIWGGAGNDELYGGPSPSGRANGRDRADDIFGGGGADEIFGGGGGDDLNGGGGRDEIEGGKGADLINGDGGADLLKGGGGKDRLEDGGGKDRMEGGGGGDRFFIGAGNDRAFGGAGVDQFVLGPGRDRIEGGGGADQFFAGENTDFDATIITDFSRNDAFAVAPGLLRATEIDTAAFRAQIRDTGLGSVFEAKGGGRVIFLDYDKSDFRNDQFAIFPDEADFF